MFDIQVRIIGHQKCYKQDIRSKSKYNYNSYDEGYDDIYMDGDYDYDRYDRDIDYADGADDAMDESGEDWQIGDKAKGKVAFVTDARVICKIKDMEKNKI